MRFTNRHLRIAVILLVGSVAYNIYYYFLRSTPRVAPPSQAAPLLGEVGSRPAPARETWIDPATLPAPPSVDLTTAPSYGRSPFLTPAEFAALGRRSGGSVEIGPAPLVRSILFSPNRRLAMINTSVVRVGESVAGWKVVDITREAVTLADSGGKQTTVSLRSGALR